MCEANLQLAHFPRSSGKAPTKRSRQGASGKLLWALPMRDWMPRASILLHTNVDEECVDGAGAVVLETVREGPRFADPGTI